MKYNRLTRELFFDVGGKEYSIIPKNWLLSRIESACPNGESLVSVSVNRKPPTIPMMVETFCAGLLCDGKRVDHKTAEELCDKYIEENGVANGLMNLYYAVMAVSNFLGKDASDAILAKIGIANVDTEEVPKKNNHQAARK